MVALEKDDGKMPDDSDRLINSVITGPSISKHSFRMSVGMMSRRHCLFGAENTIWRISVREAG